MDHKWQRSNLSYQTFTGCATILPYMEVWHSKAQYGTVWQSMAQYGTVRHSMAQYGTLWHSMAQYSMFIKVNNIKLSTFLTCKILENF